MTVGLIWAQTNSGVIGRKGAIPWHLPEDMAHFKELTMGHTVVMGRRTWESLPAKVRPLPGRRNIVITRQADYVAEGAEVMTSLDDALTADDYVWVIGGAEIYPLALPRASVCEVTEIALDEPPEDDEAFAPLLDKSWVADTPAWRSSRVGLRYRFSTYRRR